MKKHRRIDIVVKYFYPVAAGIETNILETYRYLVEDGWDVTIHTSLDTLTEKNVLGKRAKVKGLKVKRYPFKWWSFWPQINYRKTDIVALHNFNILPHFFIMAYTCWFKLLGQKHYSLILTPHGGFNPEWSIFPKLTAVIKQLYHTTLGTIMTNLSVDGIRAVSAWEQKEMIKKGLNKKIIKTIPNGIEDDAYLDIETLVSKKIKAQTKSLGRYIIQIGRIYSIKNYETTIRALTLVPRNINFAIIGPVGDQLYQQKLHQLIADLGLTNRVHFLGVVRGVDKYYLIKKAQMMVHMAMWESFCNVVHEGMSQGLICLVANNTALPLLIKNGKNGYTIATKDWQAVAAKINYVLAHTHQPKIKAMKQRNQVFGLQHSWRNVAAQMDHWYQQFIRKNYAKQPFSFYRHSHLQR